MLKLIRAGFSPTLSRTILERMPETADAAQSMHAYMMGDAVDALIAAE